jgi:Cu(I)/Ag(I) efflux system membrane fusion protein
MNIKPNPRKPADPHRIRALPGLILLAMLSLPFWGCSPGTGGGQPDHSSHGSSALPAPAASDAQLYQCSMHPNIVSDKPGQCPICAMDLQPVRKSGAPGIPGRASVELDPYQRQLINIRTVEARIAPSILSLRTVGVLEHDSAKVFTVSAWTSGRIEELYVDQPEIDVALGDPLYRIYSPELYSTLRDLVALNRRQPVNSLLAESTEHRLKLLGLSDSQIAGFRELDQAPLSIDVPSPAAGKVMMKTLKQGDYVKTGDPLYTIVDLTHLWLIVTIYEPELSLVSPGMKVVATTPAYAGEEFHGEVTLINHHINKRARSAELRVEFQQPGQLMLMSTDADGHMKHRHRLLPDMYMNARLEADLGEHLQIPATAVFDTGRRQYVFVERGEGLFLPVQIQTGPRSGDAIVVREGLEPGQRVVVDGNFLLDSESQLKAAAEGSFIDDEETDTPGAHSAPPETTGIPLPDDLREPYDALLDAYFNISAQLAADSIDGLSGHLDNLREQTGQLLHSESGPDEQDGSYRNILREILRQLDAFDSSSVETARAHFGNLSHALIHLLTHFPPPGDHELHVAHCPMWKQSPGDWVQSGRDIVNPYMGARMLSCGEITRTLGRAEP